MRIGKKVQYQIFKRKRSRSVIKTIKSLYDTNGEITGEYDISLAVKCSNGTFVGQKKGDTVVFRGIPYAQSPVGDLRWKCPQPALDREGVFEAYHNGKSPIQTEWRTEVASYYRHGEDCLYLNMWISDKDKSPKKAVMVFFHGGSYGWGGTVDPIYDGLKLVSTHPEVILITVGYRTGLMGFVDLSYLKGGEEYEDSPNLGLLDQIESLRWIKKNCQSFGGDPDNITIFGESAGGGSASLLPIIPEAKGLFRRVIAESGSVALTFSKKECRSFTDRLVRETKAQSVDDLLKLSEDELKKVNEKLNYYNNFPQRDGKLIPLDPYSPYEKGETSDVDMLIGTNANEMNYWIGEVGGIVPYRLSVPIKFENDLPHLSDEDRKLVDRFFKFRKGHKLWKMTEFYNELMFRLPAIKQAEGHSENGAKTYMYYWTKSSTIPLRGACHAVELAYIFGNYNTTIYTGLPASPLLSKAVQQMWVNFAKSGDPSIDGLHWPEYERKNRQTMVLDIQCKVVKDLLKSQRVLLSPILKYMINPSYAELSYNVPFVKKGIAIGLGILLAVIAIILLIVLL